MSATTPAELRVWQRCASLQEQLYAAHELVADLEEQAAKLRARIAELEAARGSGCVAADFAASGEHLRATACRLLALRHLSDSDIERADAQEPEWHR